MSDSKRPSDEGSRDPASADPSPSDRPPLDHVPPDEPSADRVPPDDPPRDHVPPDAPSASHAPQDDPPKDGVSPDEPPRDHAPRDGPPLDHVPPEEPARDRAAPESNGESQSPEGGIGEHLTSRDSWLRLLFMVLFIALWSITRFVVFAVVVLQALFLLFSGKRNARLADFGASLAVYSYELVAYLTFASEEQPFPFSDWPDGSAPADEAEQADSE